MDLELSVVYDLFVVYKKSIIEKLDHVDEYLLDAISQKDGTLQNNYTLTMDMLSVIQNYLNIMFTAESVAEKLVPKPFKAPQTLLSEEFSSQTKASLGNEPPEIASDIVTRAHPRHWRKHLPQLLKNQCLRGNFEWEACAPTYDILEADLKVCEVYSLCNVQSPSEFYLCLNDELCEGLQHAINVDITNDLDQRYSSKVETKTFLGALCFTFSQTERKWFRVQVLDWMWSEPYKVYVQFIDNGRRDFCLYPTLRGMTHFYAKIPRLAIRCHLAAIEVTESSTAAFNQVTSGNLRLLFVQKQGDSYAVDFLRDGESKTVGELMEEKGFVAEIKKNI